MIACKRDTDGDGDCHLCHHLPGKCLQWMEERVDTLETTVIVERAIRENAEKQLKTHKIMWGIAGVTWSVIAWYLVSHG